jgi:hypothetical protein
VNPRQSLALDIPKSISILSECEGANPCSSVSIEL